MAIVIFNPENFRAAYPQFADSVKYSDAYLQNIFNQACLLCNNRENSRIPYDPSSGEYERETLLYLLVCHMATIKDKGTVGTLTSAAEGSVSASFFVEARKGAAWYQQTPCGYTYWQMTQKYRVGGILALGRKNH